MRGDLTPWAGSVDHRLARTAEELLGACKAYSGRGHLDRGGFKLYRRDEGPRPDTIVAAQVLGSAEGWLVVEIPEGHSGYLATFTFEVPVHNSEPQLIRTEGVGPTVEEAVERARESFFIFLKPLAMIGDRLSGGPLIGTAVDTAMMTKRFKP